MQTLFSREDVRRCGALAPDLREWAEGKTYEEEAQISYEKIETRIEPGQPVPIVDPAFVTVVGVRFAGRPAWRFSGQVDGLWGGPEPQSWDELTAWLKDDLRADNVVVRAFAGNIGEIDAVWLAKDSGFDYAAAEKLVVRMGLV
jgi:hypothetical protein